jgi:hypothetical protein
LTRTSSATASGVGLPAVALSQLTEATVGDLRGLAAQSCAEAAADLWLVGSGTSTGRRGRLLVSNPTPVPATVDITVFGNGGPVKSPAGTGVAIPAGSERAFLIEALAPRLDSVVVRVTATSGRVSGVLHDDLLRGITPGGVDDVTAGAGPARRQYLPGVSIARSLQGVVGDVLPRRSDAAGAVAIRVAVPGSRDGAVRVHLLGAGGAVTWAGGVVTVPRGTVADLPITGVPDGLYTAVVESDVPVVAGALVGRAEPTSSQAGTPAALGRGVAPAEFGWIAAASSLSSAAAVAVPIVLGAQATLVLGAPGAGSRIVHWA